MANILVSIALYTGTRLSSIVTTTVLQYMSVITRIVATLLSLSLVHLSSEGSLLGLRNFMDFPCRILLLTVSLSFLMMLYLCDRPKYLLYVGVLSMENKSVFLHIAKRFLFACSSSLVMKLFNCVVVWLMFCERCCCL